MAMAYDDPNMGKPLPQEPPAAKPSASPPEEEGYASHPLFQIEGDGRELRDIHYVSFKRRRSTDGNIDHCPEDIPADEIHSWAEVIALWGGGEYKAVAKNRHHRILGYHPQGPGEWILFDLESKPFTLRNPSRYRHAPPAPAAPAAPPLPSPAPPSFAPASPFELAVLELRREFREFRESREMRGPPPPPPTDPVVVELLRELRAQRGANNENALLEMVKALMAQRHAEPPTTVAVELLRAMREFTPPPPPPPPPQPTVADRLSEYRQIRDLTAPGASASPPSEFGELKELFSSVMQADMMSKATREAPAPPPAPPPAVERRPPPRRPLLHVPGLGLVDLVEPEPPPRPRAPAPELDLDALLSDPVQRARVLKRLTDERLGAPGVDPSALVPVRAALSAPAAVEAKREVAPPIAAAAGRAPTAAHEPEPAEPSPTPAGPEPMVAEPTPTAPEPIVAATVPLPVSTPAAPEPMVAELMVAEPTTAAPEPIVAATAPPVPTPATPEPIARVFTPPAVPLGPRSTEPASPKERGPIGLPALRPAGGSQPITPKDCERAVHALRTFSRMPPDLQRVELGKIPGIDGRLDEMMMAMNALPPDAWPAVVANLPPEMVRVLLDGPGG